MKIFQEEYKLSPTKQYKYNTYLMETKGDKREFIKLFREAETREASKLYKGSAEKWLQAKCDLFGFYVSYPEMFAATTATNRLHPFQFYSISLCFSPDFEPVE